MRLRLQRAALAKLLAPPPHRRHAEAGNLRDLPRALALLVKFDDALAEGNRYGLHVPILPQAFPFCKLYYLWMCSSVTRDMTRAALLHSPTYATRQTLREPSSLT